MFESSIPPITGFFGKLPGRGDFIGRHLPKSFLDPWDTWLQQAIAQSHIQLGGLWRECYCTSPIWRFALSPGLCGPAVYTGILMPSVDRVGRYYPLVITAPLESGWPLLVLPMAGKAWFEQAEQLALMGLDLDRLDLDDFSQQVKALGAPPMATFSVEGAVAGNAWYCPLPEALELALATPLLASDLLRRGLPQISLWWTEGSERVTRCLLICQGLPPVSGFAALLSGEWRHWGWTEKSVANIMRCSGEPPTTKESSL
ncbi:MAG: type VI secretion system-associated protein TagF [Candidatus Competibacteraceae bacterium]|nr:type VI secretion system-associated protein TagF [Candidatus Competibacteraceae bacterium]